MKWQNKPVLWSHGLLVLVLLLTQCRLPLTDQVNETVPSNPISTLHHPIELKWDFTQSLSPLGWQEVNQISNFRVENQALRFNTIGNDPYMIAPLGFYADATVFDSLEIRMKNATDATIGEVFFYTQPSPGFSAEKQVSFAIAANSTTMQTYTINLAENVHWYGTITGLRIDPHAGSSGGSVAIESIRLFSSNPDIALALHPPVGSRGVAGLSIDSQDRLVMMTYFASIDLMLNHPPNNGEILNMRDFLENNLWERNFGVVHSTWFWDEPYLGYYSPMDQGVIEQHIQWMNEASIDIIIIDNTNVMNFWAVADFIDGLSYYEVGVSRPQTKLLDTLLDMRRRGLQTPAVVFWQHTNQHDPNHDKNWSVTDVYNRFYHHGAYDELFAYWEGRPFMIFAGELPEFAHNRFTTRRMWALQPTPANKEWVFMYPPDHPTRFGKNGGMVEQVGVTPTPHWWYQTSAGAYPRSGGKTFFQQWQAAFQQNPKFITLNMFNLWSTITFPAPPGIPGTTQGALQFTDSFTREFSVDIEPMKGGHGDLYLHWTGEYARAFKQGQPQPQFALAELNGLKGHYPLYDHSVNGIGGFGSQPRLTSGTTMLGLQHSSLRHGPSPSTHQGSGFANIMFDTMTANLFSQGWISLRFEVPADVLSEAVSSGASKLFLAAHFDEPSGAVTGETAYGFTVRFMNQGNYVYDVPGNLTPNTWNEITAALPHSTVWNGGTVELLFQPSGPGTLAWYGNLGIDSLEFRGNNGEIIQILADFE